MTSHTINHDRLLASGTLELGGSFSTADIGTFERIGGMVDLTGTLDNMGTILALDAATGDWRLVGGRINGGTVTGADGAKLIGTSSGGTLDGVVLDVDLDMAPENLPVAEVTVTNGLVLNGTTWIGMPAGDHLGVLHFAGSQTLSGAGTVVFGRPGKGNMLKLEDASTTLTIGPGITVRGQNGTLGGSETGVTVVNQGRIVADSAGGYITIQGQAFVNRGTVEAQNGGTLSIQTPAAIDGLGVLRGTVSGTLEVTGNLLGVTQNADHYDLEGTLRFAGSGTVSTPQLLEAMGQDLGLASSGFSHNFAYGTLFLTANTYVQLVDQSDNASGVGTEAIYVNSLIVPNGTTLDLNGLALYVRASQIAGSIMGGTVIQVPDGGPISLASPAPGTISIAGELDEWTFFGRGGQLVTVVVNPGSSPPATLSPYLNWAEIQLLDPADNILDTAASALSGAVVILNDVVLPTDGEYTIRIHAAGNTGNYLVTAWDSTPDVASLLLNRQVNGQIENPYSVDLWQFSAVANTQVRFELVNRPGSGVVFDLTGSGGWTGFSDIGDDSTLITLPQSGSYILTAHSTSGQYGDSYAFLLEETLQIVLPLDITHTGTFAGTGQAQIFRIDVPTTLPMQITLDDSSSANLNELYLKLGAPPTRGDYDYRFMNPSSADQEILVPMATAGPWYLLLYTSYNSTPSSYNLLATTCELLVSHFTPDYSGNDAPATITLFGAGFNTGTAVELVGSDSTVYPATAVQIDSPNQMRAAVALQMMPVGDYWIQVSNPSGAFADPRGIFRVVTPAGPHFVAGLVVPSWVGSRAPATLYIEYANLGGAPMPAPLLLLSGTHEPFLGIPERASVPIRGIRWSGTRDRIATAPVGMPSQFVATWTSAQPRGYSHTVQVLASGVTPGLLQPGERYRIPVSYVGLNMPFVPPNWVVDWELGVIKADNAVVADWAALRDGLRPSGIAADAWNAIYANFTAQAGSTWGGYVQMLDDNAAYLARLGQPVADVSRLLAFEFQQADAISPLSSLATEVDAFVQAPGLPLMFGRVFPQPISLRYQLGPLGRGWSHNWQFSLNRETDGTVTIFGPAGSQRIFQPDSRTGGATFFSQQGDYGELTHVAGQYLLREPDGLLYAFTSDGKFNYVEDPNGNRITATYTGDLLSLLTHSSGQWMELTYNADARISRITDSTGRETSFTFTAPSILSRCRASTAG